jgi:selenide,water dikinase
MVPGYLANMYTTTNITATIDLDQLADWAKITFINDGVLDVDVGKQLVYLVEQSAPIPYDLISFDIGSATKGLDEISGAFDFAIPTRPISDLIQRIEQADADVTKLIQQVEVQEDDDGVPNATEDTRKTIQVVVVGGGCSGIELALSLIGRWRPMLGDLLDVTLVTSECVLLPGVSVAGRKALEQVLQQKGIQIYYDTRVTEVQKDSILFECGMRIPFTHCLLATGAGCHDLALALKQRGLATTPDGWIEVLQSVSHPNIFAAGDCCALNITQNKILPKAGVISMQEGPILTRNLARYIKSPEIPLTSYHPQDDSLKLIGCGDGTGIGFHFGMVMQGKWVWQLKDAMDQRFLTLFLPQDLSHQSSPWNMTEYDEINDIPMLPLEARDAATLLQRTDDGVDYKEVWAILKHMTSYKAYRLQVLECIQMPLSQDEMSCLFTILSPAQVA